MSSTSFVANMQLPVHRWFRYSAGFSAQWVESVLQDQGDARVLDPFAGSGTTLLAAQRVGAESVGVDGHPFVARVARAKLHWTADVERFEARAAAVIDRHLPAALDGEPPALLGKCYSPGALTDLLGLRDAIAAEATGDPVSELLWLALVAVVRPVSHAGTAQWQYVLPNKRTPAVPVLAAFAQQAARMTGDMRAWQSDVSEPSGATCIAADCRNAGLVADGWATHVICSPPYANNYDYADATRLEQTVLGEVSSWADLKVTRAGLVRSCSQHMAGYDPREALEDPILAPIADDLGAVHVALAHARLHHGGRKAYHTMVLAYFHDLAKVWGALRRACAPGASVCFVVGDSAPYGIHVPVERWLGELALAHGFDGWHFEKVRDRNVKWKNRKHDVPLHEGRLWVQA